MQTISSTQDFEQLLKQDGKLKLVDFYADWCGPCKALAPTLDEIPTEFGEKVDVIKVNIDQHTDIAQKYQIRGIPAIFFSKYGEIKAS